jgi:hypothetical protein
MRYVIWLGYNWLLAQLELLVLCWKIIVITTQQDSHDVEHREEHDAEHRDEH